jgi:hypothetical protein
MFMVYKFHCVLNIVYFFSFFCTILLNEHKPKTLTLKTIREQVIFDFCG